MGIVAAGVAVIVAVALSPVFPIGLARIAEPDPGLDVDGTVSRDRRARRGPGRILLAAGRAGGANGTGR